MEKPISKNPLLGFIQLTFMALMPRAAMAQDIDAKLRT